MAIRTSQPHSRDGRALSGGLAKPGNAFTLKSERPHAVLTLKVTPIKERVGRIGQRRQLVIPREILETLKLQAGELVAFAGQKNGVPIKPKRPIGPEDPLPPEEAKIVRRGEAQLKRGELTPWRVVKHALPR